MIVGLVGKIGSGKSTAAEVFIEAGFTRIAFADYMKETLAEYLDVPREWFYTEEGKNRAVKVPSLFSAMCQWLRRLENDCPWCDFDPAYHALANRHIDSDDDSLNIATYRELLQWAGTELLRACDLDFHVKVTMERINNNPHVNYVMDDVRFPNEMNAIINNDGRLIKLLRNWDVPATHTSETAMNDVPNTIFDWTIHNQDSTREEFIATIGFCMQEILEDQEVQAITEITDSPRLHDRLYDTWHFWVENAMETQRERYADTNAELDVDDPFLLAIITEQLGKAADMLNYLRLQSTADTYEADLEHLRNALVNVVASGAMWLEKFE
jgi:hypothetical protein